MPGFRERVSGILSYLNPMAIPRRERNSIFRLYAIGTIIIGAGMATGIYPAATAGTGPIALGILDTIEYKKSR
jgi:hypothetical protein